MLDLFGSSYVVEHVVAECTKDAEEKVFRVYVTDLMKAVAEYLGVNVTQRMVDFLEKGKPVNEKTGDEIALEVMKKAGLKVKENVAV